MDCIYQQLQFVEKLLTKIQKGNSRKLIKCILLLFLLRNLKLKDYLENTLTLEDFFINISRFEIPNEEPQESLNYTIETVMTMYKGRCYTIEFFNKFKKIIPITLEIKSKEELTLYVHDPGFTIWMYQGYWPKRPKLYSIGGYDGLVDITITKSIFIRTKDCMEYSYRELKGVDICLNFYFLI